MSATEGRRRSRSDQHDKFLHQTGVDILIRLHVVYKIVKLYERNNEMYAEQARSLYEVLAGILSQQNEAGIKVRQGAVFFNGVRLKFILATYPIFRFMLEEFQKREIGALVFQPGLTEDELLRFIFVLAKKEKGARISFEEMLAEAQEADLPHIGLEKAVAEQPLGLNKNTAKIYFLSILHLKESFERDKRNEKIKLNTTRRLMQAIFNHMTDNETFIFGLTNIKNHDEYTLNHSVNVCLLSIALGRRLGLSRSELVDLGIAAFFHDLGKLDTPQEILNKPGKLEPEERAIMERHPYQGAQKLIQLQEFKRLPLRALHVALEHHIKEDASGYPQYFHKRSPNLYSKIVKITDYFDAITTPRVYRKKAFTRPEALSLMLEHSGTEFHPTLLKAFVGIMGNYPVGTLVLLDSGEVGIVFESNPEFRFLFRPRVKLIADTEGNKIDGEVIDLMDRAPDDSRFLRSIVKTLDPESYGIRVADYFLARTEQ
jgi:HD-GYP domain-containing protein (c-di-GMP phosphodiesterase class II)